MPGSESDSIAETDRIGGINRHEIGHGALAERSIAPVIPSNEGFPQRTERSIMLISGAAFCETTSLPALYEHAREHGHSVIRTAAPA